MRGLQQQTHEELGDLFDCADTRKRGLAHFLHNQIQAAVVLIQHLHVPGLLGLRYRSNHTGIRLEIFSTALQVVLRQRPNFCRLPLACFHIIAPYRRAAPLLLRDVIGRQPGAAHCGVEVTLVLQAFA